MKFSDKSKDILSQFKSHCQEIYICYSFALSGIVEKAKLLSSYNPDHSSTLFVGSGHPSEGKSHGKMSIGRYLSSSARNGSFSEYIGAAFIVMIYSIWEEQYRKQIANEISVSKNEIKTPLMGDLRKIRNVIVHDNARIPREFGKLEVLRWEVSSGINLKISEDMFKEIIERINEMNVHVNGYSVASAETTEF